MLETVEKSDMNIFNRLLNVGAGEIYLQKQMLNAIETGRATVYDLTLLEEMPSSDDVRAVSSTLSRMRKFGRRGHDFNCYPFLSMGKDESSSHCISIPFQGSAGWG